MNSSTFKDISIMYKEVVHRLWKQAVPTDSYLGTESNDSPEGARSKDFGSIQGKIELGEQAKVVRMPTGVGRSVTTKGSVDVRNVSPEKGPPLPAGFFSPEILL
jgi:hypothetical protein